MTQSVALRPVLARARKFSAWPITVIIQGESGTGKTWLARQIHEMSPRVKMPFEAYSLANPDVDLMSSELFGHVEGGFTGARGRRNGLLASANRGTVFFDEIGKCPTTVQRKLLQVLDSHSFRSVGSDRMLKVDVRLIVAANEPLRDLAEQGVLARDFMARLGLAELRMPPLRDRREDIMPLAHWFAARHMAEGPAGKRERVPGFSKALANALTHYSWPDNVRELQNLVRVLLALGEGARELDVDLLEHGLEHYGAVTQPPPADEPVSRKQVALRMIERMDGVKAKAAKELGWSESTMYRVLRGKG